MGWQRRRYSGRNLERAVTIADLRERAMRRVPGFVFEYVEGGSDDEFALRNNREAFEALQFVPATLVNTADRHQRVSLFGQELASPLIVGPTGGNGVLSQIQFTAGKKHLIRLVNTGINNFLHVGIDQHTMTVVADDFIPIQPYSTQSVTLTVGTYQIRTHDRG